MSTESTPRERLARLVAVGKRTRMYWRSACAIALVGIGISLFLALRTKRSWRSEATILYRNAIQTGRDGESTASKVARLGPKLRDVLNARPTLAKVVEEFGLYPHKQARSMVEAVEEMQGNIGFRARNSDTFVISFAHEDPVVAQRVTARLAEIAIETYGRENIDTATLTLDFLRRELDDANRNVESASRALATFLANHPQFSWGINDSPYATAPIGTVGALPSPVAAPRGSRPGVAVHPAIATLEQKLAQIENELGGGGAPAVAKQSEAVAEAQKQRQAAAAELEAAQTALREKLQTVTPLHPDAAAARSRVEAARQALAVADAALSSTLADATRAQALAQSAIPDGRRDELEKERSALRRRIAEARAKYGSVLGKEALGGDPKGDKDKAGKTLAGKADPKLEVVELETEWHRLRLELDRARERFRTAQANERAASISASAAEKKSEAEMMILEPAYLPTRAERGRGRVLYAGTVIAIFAALGYALARVLLDDRLFDEGDIVAIGGPSVLVSLPNVPAEQPLPERAIVPAVDPSIDADGPACSSPAWDASYAAPDGRTRAWAEAEAAGAASSPAAARRARGAADTARFRDRETLRGFGGAIHLGPSSSRSAAAAAFSDEPAVATQEAKSAAQGTPPLAALARYGRYELGRAAPYDRPEVEVIGADVDEDGEGVLALLRGSSPHLLASLRVLRHRLEQRRGDGHLVVSIVSPGREEGKTLLAIRLALTLAEADRARVVLVEGNLERPRVAAELGLRLPDQAGLTAQIRRRMIGRPLAWGVVRLTPALAVLAEPEGEPAFPAALHSLHFEAAVRALRKRYEYVVIDGPSVLGSGDANVLEGASDGVVVVARSGMTKGAALSKAAAQLGERRILGVVLNDADLGAGVGPEDRRAA